MTSFEQDIEFWTNMDNISNGTLLTIELFKLLSTLLELHRDEMKEMYIAMHLAKS